MPENQFEILSNIQTIEKKILKLLWTQNIQKIELYCNNFEAYKQSSFTTNYKIYAHLSLINKKRSVPIQIYNNIPFSYQSLMDALNNKNGKSHNFFRESESISIIELRETQEMIVSYLNQIVSKARKGSSAKEKEFKNLSDVVNTLLEHSKDSKEALKLIYDSLQIFQKEIINKVTSILSDEEFSNTKDQIRNSICTAFKELNKNLEDIQNEGDEFLLKTTIKFAIQAIPAIIDIVSSRGVTLSWDALLQSGGEFIKDWSDFSNNQFFYSYTLPLYTLLSQSIAPAFVFLARRSLKNILYVYTEEQIHFIDYSGCAIHSQPYALFTQYHCAFAGIITPKQTNYTTSSFTLTLFEEKDFQTNLTHISQLHNANIHFFCSPYFTSSKLVQQIQESNQNNKKTTCTPNTGKNYLILSQCPTKANAGISQSLIQSLGYEIKDENNLESPQSLRQKPKGQHNPVIDYSKYSIKINAKDNDPFVLSLSPFGFVPQERYTTLQKQRQEVQEIEEGMYYKDPSLEDLKKMQESPPVIQSLRYIENFFQSTTSLRSYFQKDEELFQEEIRIIKNYFASLGERTSAGELAKYYPQDIILMTLMFQVIQQNYKNVQYNVKSLVESFFENFQKENLKETIIIEGEQIQVTLFFSYAYIKRISDHTYKSSTLCYSQQKADSLDDSTDLFCIEKFAQEVFNAKQESDYTVLHNLHSDETDKDKLHLPYLIALQAIISLFPFQHILPSPEKLAKQFLQAMLNYPDMLRVFYEQVYKDISPSKIQQNIKNKLTLDATAPMNLSESINDELKPTPEDIFSILVDSVSNEKPPKISDVLKSKMQAIAIHAVLAYINTNWVTQFEVQKKRYNKLIYTKFTNKNDAPLAIKRKEGVYYPITIHQTFLGFSFQSLILGGSLSTGGLGRAKSCFYALSENTTQNFKNTQNNFNIVRNYQLSLLFGLLCLDELRSGTILTQKDKMLQDEKFFSQDHSRKEFGRYKIDKEKHKEIYQQYNLSSEEDNGSNQSNPIESYNLAMTYLSDIQNGIFETNSKTNKIDPNKHRNFLRALDNIGKNNIKGLYVGISEKSKNKPRPKIIGRLATTIIMKDGLWLG